MLFCSSGSRHRAAESPEDLHHLVVVLGLGASDDENGVGLERQSLAGGLGGVPVTPRRQRGGKSVSGKGCERL